MSGTVRLERLEGGIAKVILDHPERLNALNNRMWDHISEIFTELSADDALRCVIVTGAGDKAFGVGADISEFEENRSTVEKARVYGKRLHGALSTVGGCRHPVIGQIHGLCVGGALELAVLCDMRICGAGSRFGIPIKRLGLVVAYAEMEPLLRLVGPANTLEILLEGRIFGAEDALRMSLVNRVVADDRVESEALATAQRIAEGAPLVARWHKRFARRLLDPRPLTEQEDDESYHCFGTEDFQIGYKAFLAKQTPLFKGK